MKVLNLYAGIGGNRKLWIDCEVTAVENVPMIAEAYQDLFPDDKVVVADAHQYLLDHYKEFDFIWSSPPCPTHSDIRRMGVGAGMYDAEYPDMALYQEIILLKQFFKGKWVVENVKPYYEPLVPAKEIERHLFWTNFDITHREFNNKRKHRQIKGSAEVYGFDLSKYKLPNKREILRNMVNPELGLYIFNQAFGKPTDTFEQQSLL